MSKFISIPISTQVDSGTQSVLATGTNEALTSGTNTAATGTTVTVTGGNFVAIGIQANDVLYNTTQNNAATVSVVTDANNLEITGNTISANDTFVIVRPSILYDGSENFNTIAVGDIVTNSVTNATAKVTALNSGNGTVPLVGKALQLDTDIFSNAVANVDDTFSIAAPAFDLVDSSQAFVGVVNVGDFVVNTTDNTSAKVMAVDSEVRLTLDVDIMAIGETFVVYSESLSSPLLVDKDSIVSANYLTSISTKIYCNGDYEITLAHTTDISHTALTGIQNAQVNAESSINITDIVVITPPNVKFILATIV